MANYRPISLLSILSKVLERCIYNHCYQFIQSKLSFYQHGFVQGRNCVTQLIWFYHKILEALDGGHEVGAIYLDFSKAFDRIQHRALLDKLKYYGFGGTLHDWFADYVTGRSQQVVVDGVCSDLLNVTSGVPQGSILGPLLFVLYINDLPECIQKPTDIALFADDSKVSQILTGSSTDGIILQSNLDRLHFWSTDWHMDFNVKKCRAMLITRKKIPRLENEYFIDNNQLERVTRIRDLGINVTSDLRWVTHISELTAKANKILGLVIKRTCVDLRGSKTRKLLYCTLVLPLLEYGSELWSPYEIKY